MKLHNTRSRTHRKLTVEKLEDKMMLAADAGSQPQIEPPPVELLGDYRTIDGTENNANNPEWGSTDEQLLRLTSVEYEDGISDPAGSDRPSAREVSNAVVAQQGSTTNDRYLTDIVWLWGQFIDHDIDLTENADPAEPFPVEVPAGDPYFDPTGSGDETIDLNRSVYDESTGDSVDDPRQQINQITAFLDGSVVYGSDQERADALRTFEGGKLATSEGDLLPFNDHGLENAGGTSSSLFLAGDVRANENAALSAMHTLWVREHNRIADELAAADSSLTDEEIYQEARAIVTAEIQAITYNEFLPALLGFDAISPYEGYDPTVNSGIANIFSTAAYRFGHSMLSTELLRLNNDGTVIDDGNLSLSDAFFAPDELIDNGIDSLLLGATSQLAQEIDNQIVDDVRNFLFGPPGSGGFDLASLNIQRGRDHGLPDYNQARIDLGLDPVESFSDITSDPELAADLEALYGDVNNIDVWVGALAEDQLPGSSLGELNSTILIDQFERIRDGDAYWYQNIFSGKQLREIENTTLADVIERNTDVEGLQENIFFDASVIYHETSGNHDRGGDSGRGSDRDGQRGGNEVAVRVSEDSVHVTERDARRPLDSRPADEVSGVILVGSDQTRDNFRIDIAAGATWTGGIVVHGGADGGDTLTIGGVDSDDEVVVSANNVTINGQSVEYTNIETIYIEGGDQDLVQVDDDVAAEVIILERGRHQRDHDRTDDDRNRQRDDNGHDRGSSSGSRGGFVNESSGDVSSRRDGDRELTAQPIDADMLLSSSDLFAHLDPFANDRR